MHSKTTQAAQPAKKKSVRIKCSIDAAAFHMAGDREEVLAKFRKFCDETFAPIGEAIEKARSGK